MADDAAATASATASAAVAVVAAALRWMAREIYHRVQPAEDKVRKDLKQRLRERGRERHRKWERKRAQSRGTIKMCSAWRFSSHPLPIQTLLAVFWLLFGASFWTPLGVLKSKEALTNYRPAAAQLSLARLDSSCL